MAEGPKPASRIGRAVGVVLLILAAGVAGYLLRPRVAEWLASSPAAGPAAAPSSAAPSGRESAVRWWTCTMHPQIHLPKPGNCPICEMRLVPVESAAPTEAGGPPRLVLSPEARALLQIQTSPVERRAVTNTVRMVGKVQYDETRVGNITAWVAGRIDRLYVDYIGISVAKGDHMVELYSPMLISAQAELLQALLAVKSLQASDITLVKESAKATVDAARDKLRLLGLTREQVESIEKTGKSIDHVTIYAPLGGTVIEKEAREGMYVEAGTRIYTIADLTRVWVKFDAYESDLEWVRYGQAVAFTATAYPGETFHGRITFIEPTLDDRTRTVKVRADVPNADGKLKPDMFVRGLVEADVAEGGRVMAPDLAGKWICPMHPSVIKDAAGSCDLCGMPLKTAESLGYVVAGASQPGKPLVIPATAPLITGARAVVYVEVPAAEKPTYEGREVVLGPRAGDYYLVRSGLAEGERVVTHGNLNIDSALQIQAKPSMMSPQGGAAGVGHRHGETPPKASSPASAPAPPVPPSSPAATPGAPVHPAHP